ncbi:MAG TPA: FG-GAP-like repeat-containing protein, partial [Xanthomonadaceae bacterium]|nr:FG-GAP-like repeat-containing protein [Xanthomonadaceae bacterium]
GRVRASALAARTQEANAAGTVVDVLVGYSPGFANAQGGQSAALTRINFMVDYTNEAYVNSEDSTARLGRVRLVGTMQVNYADNTDNTETLENLSGYNSATGRERTPDPAFQALRAARETLGADLVSFVHDFRTPENDSCGVAWLIGGSKQGIDPNAGWDYLGYSVVSDGQDVDEGDGGNYYCEDHTFAHELGHNMGLAHDRETSSGDDGTLDNPSDYGVSDYSFGYKLSHLTSRFYTVMAYGDSGQTSYNLFSNPRKTCEGAPCGVAKGQPEAADAALSLSETMPLIAAFRASKVADADASAVLGISDYDGDGRADILWHNRTSGVSTIWKAANAAAQQAVTTVASSSWVIAGNGDFDGDGRADILWRNTADGRNTIWRSGNSGTQIAVNPVTNLAWSLVGVGDFDGDGKSDLLWRNGSNGTNAIWKGAKSGTQQSIRAVTDVAWKVAAVADFNGDGRDDILWRNGQTGANAIWGSGNASTPTAVTGVTNLAWSVAGAGDFSGDGKADILWRNASTGVNTIWKSAVSSSQQAVAATAKPGWRVAATLDFNGDGRADILWRHGTTGVNVIWRSGNANTSQAVQTVASQAWQVSG